MPRLALVVPWIKFEYLLEITFMLCTLSKEALGFMIP